MNSYNLMKYKNKITCVHIIIHDVIGRPDKWNNFCSIHYYLIYLLTRAQTYDIIFYFYFLIGTDSFILNCFFFK